MLLLLVSSTSSPARSYMRPTMTEPAAAPGQKTSNPLDEAPTGLGTAKAPSTTEPPVAITATSVVATCTELPAVCDTSCTV